MAPWAYWVGDKYRVIDEPTCTIAGAESWPRHPWTVSDPTLPTYQDCPRCGARRIRIPAGLAAVAQRVAESVDPGGHS